MKANLHTSSVAILLLGAMIAFTGCNKKKQVTAAPQGEVLVNQYCSGPEYFSNKDFFRAQGIGESMDQSTARKKAYSNARAQMASSIQTIVKGTIDNYVNSREMNNKEQVETRYEGLTREVIDQKLQGVKTICEKVVKVTSTGNYKYYVAIELSGQDLISEMNQKISADDQLKIDYDYQKFKDTFNQEMQKLEQSQPH